MTLKDNVINDNSCKYYRGYINSEEKKDNSPLSLKLYSITGYYSNDYIKPVIKEGGDRVDIISDESCLNGHLSVSLIILPTEKQKRERIELLLEQLISKYNLKNIHFTDIFGRKKILGAKTESFLSEYCSIVRKVHMSCVVLYRNKDQLLKEIKEKETSIEELYFILFWNSFEMVLPALRSNSIIHIYHEQENNFSKGFIRKSIDKLLSGIDQCMPSTNIYYSICKHPNFFSKKALMFSSLSDLVAYSTNRIGYKIFKGVPEQKIIKDPECLLMMKTIKNCFINYTGLPIRSLIDKVCSTA